MERVSNKTYHCQILNHKNLLNPTEVHNTDDDGCFDEKQYKEINHFSQESLER